MECQAIFFSEKKKNNNNKQVLSSALVVIGALRVCLNFLHSRIGFNS